MLRFRMRYSAFLLLLVLISTMSCAEKQPFDVQGHRGCRGLLPENTPEAMVKALDLGVTTLELDVVITADHQVVLSHEPFLSAEICSHPDGTPVRKDEERSLNIYRMTFDSLSAYDCGLRGNPRFPKQAAQAASKPLLKAVIELAERHASEQQRPLPWYNIETKCAPHTDAIYHPAPQEFVQLLMEVIQEVGIAERTIIQSFDVRTLQELKSAYPNIKTALLIENNRTPEENIKKLGFTPDVYSCDFELVDQQLVKLCKTKAIELIPWTVNDETDMVRLMSLGVNGIITDYPNRLMALLEQHPELGIKH